ncbi:conserved exported hypothetical protein [Candidatus Sulfopaludibacter sp. SbA3]|nr:conserved exported hypothetical protein [Candidatus Sulfopaludibacter sp. SbA3]
MRVNRRSILKGGVLALWSARATVAQKADCNCTMAPDGSPMDTGTSELRPVIERYGVELRDITRVYALPGSATRQAKLEGFYTDQVRLLDAIHFDALSQSGKVDYLLLRVRLKHEQKQVAAEARLDAEIAPLIPFQQIIIDLEESRRRMDSVDPQKCAAALQKMAADLATARAANAKASPAVLSHAAQRLVQLRNFLHTWYNFYNLYDPKFSWWVDSEYKLADAALDAHAQLLRRNSGVPGPLDAGGGRGGAGVAGAGAGRGAAPVRPAAALGSNEELSGVGPVGNDALLESLRAAMIPYTPEELIALANKEFAWCDKEMLRASGEMGFGSDWKKALEAVKNKYVEPGQMIYLVRDLSREAIDFVEKHELVTIPPMVKQDYWEEAMTPQMQLVNPFFTGGPTIQVSSPANSMSLQERLESMRGNNIYFARATVFHELIPGHHMQGYMTQRYRPYRSVFGTPFWTEGMAFYWEMLLWDLGFTHTPEQRVGALFWRMHRCARIIFSLSFHLGKMTAKQCVAFLIDRVGHEPANAEGEVRRSFNGSYEPVYQCAYMLGALQFHALHKELVDSGKMTNRAFHDAIYRDGNIPVEMVRLALNGQKVARDYETSWKFYGPLA